MLRSAGRLAPLAHRPRTGRRRLGRRGVRGRLAARAAHGRGRLLLPRPDPRHRGRDDLHAAPGRRRRTGRDWRIGRTRVRPSPGSAAAGPHADRHVPRDDHRVVHGLGPDHRHDGGLHPHRARSAPRTRGGGRGHGRRPRHDRPADQHSRDDHRHGYRPAVCRFRRAARAGVVSPRHRAGLRAGLAGPAPQGDPVAGDSRAADADLAGADRAAGRRA